MEGEGQTEEGKGWRGRDRLKKGRGWVERERQTEEGKGVGGAGETD